MSESRAKNAQSGRNLPNIAYISDRVFVDDNGCWIWQLSNWRGYGRAQLGDKRVYAHRLAWMVANGRPIPDGLTVDHICFVPLCVNPEHLQLLTRSENSRRRHPNGVGYCQRGHAFPEGGGSCRECKRQKDAEKHRRRYVPRTRRSA